ncbi:hypothetical protein BDZ89DRAFT_392834 [Hymenopellis radicata]|nr:hypothetical protein BDZ89DRAFT_392834 [Hymenopellis radicata]
MRRKDGLNLYYGNRTVKVTPKDYLQPNPVAPHRHIYRPKSKVLRVDRIPTRAGATMHELLDLLKPFGVKSVRMKMHKQQWRMYLAGFAHAEFATLDGANQALEASWSDEGLSLRGSRVYLNYFRKTGRGGERNHSNWMTFFA